MWGHFLIGLDEPSKGERSKVSTYLARKAASLGLSSQWTARGAWVAAESKVPLLALAGTSGVIIGSLFRRTQDRHPIGQQDLADHILIARDHGRSLLSGYWGSYVALLCEPRGPSWFVLRDPSGAVPVYYLERSSTLYFASTPLLFLELGLLKPKMDESFVRHALVYPRMRTSRTGIARCRELLPGVILRQGGSPELAWSPWQFTGTNDRVDNYRTATTLLRAELLSTLAAVVPQNRPLLLELSGGLDSSIIAAALAHAAIPFSSVTFATSSSDGDERRYARLVAERANVDLKELVETGHHPSLAVPDPRPRPGLTAVLRLIDDQLQHYAQERGAVLLNGGGGDNVFCALTTAAPAVDAFLTSGWRDGLSTLLDVAEVTSTTIWTASRFAIARAIAGNRGRLWHRDLRFLKAELANVPADLHPWLRHRSPGLPGKIEHVRAVVQIFDFLDTSERSASLPMLFPLLAQPIVELCLRIPTWMWIQGGRDRAVARSAFKGLVPDPVLERRNKGRLEGLFERGFRAIRPTLSELLLDGLLNAHGYLDRAAIESYLKGNEAGQHDLNYRLLGIASIELWLRSWSTEGVSLPAMASHRPY